MKYAVIALLAASPAYAGGMTAPTAAPISKTETDWTGFYAGLHFGFGQAQIETADNYYTQGATDDSYGIHAGYRHDFGANFLGAEISYSKFDGSDNELTRLTGQGGVDFGRFVPYLTVGVAQFTVGDLDDTGFVYGIGADYLVTDRVMVGAQITNHRFKDFGDIDGYRTDYQVGEFLVSYRF